MLKKIKNGLVFVLIACPACIGLPILGLLMELVYRFGIYLGYMNPDIKMLMLGSGLALGFLLFIWTMLKHFLTKQPKGRNRE